MRHKGTKSFEFITRTGNIKLHGIYYHCGCSSKSVADIVSDGRKFSHQACELTSRYSASQSYQQASKYLRKYFGIWVSHEMLRNRVLAVSGQIKDIRDNDPGTSEPKQSRKDLQEKCKALSIPYIITEKRQIEDYFTEDAVRQGLPSNILSGWKYEAGKPMNEQLPTKKYNAKIAAAMKWDDVVKHKDIMKVFEEIDKFANNLKPETNGE